MHPRVQWVCYPEVCLVLFILFVLLPVMFRTILAWVLFEFLNLVLDEEGWVWCVFWSKPSTRPHWDCTQPCQIFSPGRPGKRASSLYPMAPGGSQRAPRHDRTQGHLENTQGKEKTYLFTRRYKTFNKKSFIMEHMASDGTQKSPRIVARRRTEGTHNTLA